MSQPTVSVIVITYNQQQTIEQCLDSILQQKCSFDFEIVVGEDCSTDRTAEICQSYALKFPQIRLFSHSKNKGIVNNYFDLILEAKGEFLADCAGDDYWIDPYKLQKQVDLLEQNPHISLVHTNWQEEIEETKTIRHRARRCSIGNTSLIDGEILTQYLPIQIDQIAIHLCTACYRRVPFLAFYHRYNDLFRGDDIPCEDLQIAYAMCCLGQIAYIDQETLNYRVHPQSLTNSHDQQKRFQFAKQLVLLTHRFDRHFTLEPISLSNYYQTRFAELCRFALRIDSPEQIKQINQISQQINHPIKGKANLLWQLVRFTPTRKLLKGIRYLYLKTKRNEQ